MFVLARSLAFCPFVHQLDIFVHFPHQFPFRPVAPLQTSVCPVHFVHFVHCALTPIGSTWVMTKATGYARAHWNKFRRSSTKKASSSRPAAGHIPLEWSERVRGFVVDRFLEGSLSGRDVAELAFLLTKCGLPLEDLAVDPDQASFASSGNASRKVVQALGLDVLERSFFKVALPSVDPDGNRFVKEHSCRMFHEVLTEALSMTNVQSYVESTLDLVKDCPNWKTHAVRLQCVASGDLCLPFGVFIDGACWKGKGAGAKDALLCFYCNLIGCSHRHTFFAVRKDHMCGAECDCGCRGRCTFTAFERFMVWSAQVAAAGEIPLQAYCGRPWSADRIWRDCFGPWGPLQGPHEPRLWDSSGAPNRPRIKKSSSGPTRADSAKPIRLNLRGQLSG